jgi:hypothetical protein
MFPESIAAGGAAMREGTQNKVTMNDIAGKLGIAMKPSPMPFPEERVSPAVREEIFRAAAELG